MSWRRAAQDAISADNRELRYVPEDVVRTPEQVAALHELRARKPKYNLWSRAELALLKQSEFLARHNEQSLIQAAATAMRNRFTLLVEEEVTGSVATAAAGNATTRFDLFLRAAAGGKKAPKRKGLFQFNEYMRGKASAQVTYCEPECSAEVRDVHARTADGPLSVRVAHSGKQIALRVSRVRARGYDGPPPPPVPRIMFEVPAGALLPLQVAYATELKLESLHVVGLVEAAERSVFRGNTKVTLSITDMPTQLTNEPWLELNGERCALRFLNGGPPTCSRCFVTGHTRSSGCPAAAAAASTQCTSCQRVGHAASDCWTKNTACFHCAQLGHVKSACPRIICFGCGKNGHTKAACSEAKKQGGDGAKRARPAPPADAATDAAGAAAAAEAGGAAAAEEGGAAEGMEDEKNDDDPPAAAPAGKQKRPRDDSPLAPAPPIIVPEALCLRVEAVVTGLGIKRAVTLADGAICLDQRGRGAKDEQRKKEREAEEKAVSAIVRVLAAGGNDEAAAEAALPILRPPAAAAAAAPAVAEGKKSRSDAAAAEQPAAAKGGAKQTTLDSWSPRGTAAPSAAPPAAAAAQPSPSHSE